MFNAPMGSADTVYPLVDLDAIAERRGVALRPALEVLAHIYADIDRRNAANTQHLDLPCHRGCDACCHESVFLTRLEFLGAWDWAQRNLDDDQRRAIIERGLQLYQINRDIIESFEAEPEAGSVDHLDIAKQLKFRCPLLSEDGTCMVYPMRELLARVFGCSFNRDGGIYGCHLVGTHLGGKTVTLLGAEATARQLVGLPWTERRQVYPYFIHWLYAG